MTWTRFYDVHSGGTDKIKHKIVYVAAAEDDARKLFAEAFGHDPGHVTCDCCGPDFSVIEEPDLDEAIAWDLANLAVHGVTRDDILVVAPPT